VDALIIANARFENPGVADLQKRGLPFVLTNRRSPGLPSVTCNDLLGGKLVARHLIKRGHRNLAIIAGDPRMSTTKDRVRGFVTAAAELGVEVSESNVSYSGFDAISGERGMIEILERGSKPDAVFAIIDFAALGAIGALRERGLRVPDDMAVA